MASLTEQEQESLRARVVEAVRAIDFTPLRAPELAAKDPVIICVSGCVARVQE